MRIPVHQLKGKAPRREETPEDLFAALLSKTYDVSREKSFSYTDAQGAKQTMVMDIVIPKHKMIVEIQKKQDTKGIIAEIARDKVARANGWTICRLSERDARNEDEFWQIKREIERSSK